MVNSEANEKVFDKRRYKNYKGCDKNLCGTIKYDGEIVPFSSGFCCSCSDNSDNNQNLITNELISASKRVVEDYENFGNGQNMVFDSNIITDYDNNGDLVEDRDEMIGLIPTYLNEIMDNMKKKRRTKRGAVFISPKIDQDPEIRINYRSGQPCSSNSQEPFDDYPKSEDSTHCLQFSNEWYAVYKLKEPKIEHEISLKIYQKTEDRQSNTRWKDLTNSQIIKLGTNQEIFDNQPNIFIKYKLKACDFSLDHHNHMLLIPQDGNKQNRIDEESLVLPKNLVSTDGKQCDVAGVGFEAFYNQEKRCLQPQGTCLKNQPKHLLMEDKMNENKNGSTEGKYLLKYFAPPIPDQKIQDHIRLYRRKSSKIRLDIELNADFLALLLPHSSAIITEVYTEALNPQKIRITAKVTNSGLISGIFLITLNGCSLELPASFNDISSKPVLIHPQNQHIFILNIDCLLPESVNQFDCFLNVFNINRELIAWKPIRFQKFDRCICLWYCACKCVQTDDNLKCDVLSLDEYYASGFQGGLPVSSHLIELSDFDHLLSTIFHLFIFLTFLLWLMGLIKAIIGLFCCDLIGFWGLDLILGLAPEQLDGEGKLIRTNQKNCYCPKSKPHLSYISWQVKFWLNVFFFFIYPLAFLNVLIRKLFFVSYTNEKNESFEIIEEDKCCCENDDNENDNESIDNNNDTSGYRRPSIGRSYVILSREDD